MGEHDVTVFAVEAEASLHQGLLALATSLGFGLEIFDSAERFLATSISHRPGCLLANLQLAGMTGVEFLERLAARGSCPPVIFLTSQPALPLVVQAIQAGAFTVLEGDGSSPLLRETLGRAVEQDQRNRSQQGRCHELRTRVARLDSRERQVWHLVVGDHPNKAIARSLGVSQRTVDRIRATVFAKLGVQSAVQATRLAMELEHAPLLHGSPGNSNGGSLHGYASAHTAQGSLHLQE